MTASTKRVDTASIRIYTRHAANSAVRREQKHRQMTESESAERDQNKVRVNCSDWLKAEGITETT